MRLRPPPTRKGRLLWLVVGLGFAAALVVFGAYNTGYIFSPYREANYVLGSEVGAFGRFCNQLEQDKMVRSGFLLRRLAQLTGLDTQVQSKTYTLNNHMGTWGLLRRLGSPGADTRPFLIKEGDDLFEVALNLEHEGLASSQAAMDYFGSEAVRSNLKERFDLPEPLANIEGFLYPNTYRLNPSRSLEDLVSLAVDEFDRTIYKSFLAGARKQPPNDLHSLLILASMVEKESNLPEERFWVSAVIHNRMQQNMRLELCVSLAYVLRKKRFEQGRLKRGSFIRLYRNYFSIRSPYNTYFVSGLPLGPIGSPSAQSFHATLHPAQNNVLYFVSKGDGTGSHWFSGTYKEHLQNIRRYKSNLERYGSNFKANARSMGPAP